MIDGNDLNASDYYYKSWSGLGLHVRLTIMYWEG